MERPLWVRTISPEETRMLGAALAPTLLPGDVLSLTGDLGAGKTTFVQGVAAGSGVHRRVTSPTFTIVHEYQGRIPIIHMDVYRLDSMQEVLDLGFEELLDPAAVLIVEWGEAVAPLLPKRYVEISIRRGHPDLDDERVLVFRPHGAEWVPKLRSMRETAEGLFNAASSDASARFSDAPPDTGRGIGLTEG